MGGLCHPRATTRVPREFRRRSPSPRAATRRHEKDAETHTRTLSGTHDGGSEARQRALTPTPTRSPTGRSAAQLPPRAPSTEGRRGGCGLIRPRLEVCVERPPRKRERVFSELRETESADSRLSGRHREPMEKARAETQNLKFETETSSLLRGLMNRQSIRIVRRTETHTNENRSRLEVSRKNPMRMDLRFIRPWKTSWLPGSSLARF